MLVWAAVAATAVAWGLKLFVRPLAVPASATVAVQLPSTVADLSPLFGVAPPPVVSTEQAAPPPPEASRFQLIGVVAARAVASQGLALIAVDGKTPRAYRVGAAIDQGLVLQSVQARKVDLGPRGGVATVSLELPALPPPATGVPTPATGAPNLPPAAAAPPLPMPPPGMAPQVLPGVTPNPAVSLQERLRALRSQGPVNQGAPQPNLMPQAPGILPGAQTGNANQQR